MIQILINPVVTEKSVSGTNNRFYSFFVHPDANKYQVKQAVRAAYKVEVESVRIINVKSKQVRRGKHVGTTTARKKAIVKLKPKNKIEFFEKL